MAQARNQSNRLFFDVVYQPWSFCLYSSYVIFFLIRSLVDPTKAYSQLSSAVLCFIYVYFTVFWDRRSLQIRHAVSFFQHGFAHAFKCSDGFGHLHISLRDISKMARFSRRWGRGWRVLCGGLNLEYNKRGCDEGDGYVFFFHQWRLIPKWPTKSKLFHFIIWGSQWGGGVYG